MLKFDGLTKKYGRFTALDHVSFQLEHGIYALLGPNGAGKSTMMHLLVGLLEQSDGSILYHGKDTRELGADFRRQIGYMPQYPGFYPDFTAMSLMRYMADMKELPRKQAAAQCTELLRAVNLYDQRSSCIKTFSGGMRQRLGLAQALLGNPDVLILDEPTAGLDPKERVRFRNLIRRLASEKTVIFCTHIVPDIETIAKEVLLLHHGKLLRKAPIPVLLGEIDGKVWEVIADADETEQLLDRFPRSSLVNSGMQTAVRIVSDTKPHPQAAARQAVLEDVYLYMFEDAEA